VPVLIWIARAVLAASALLTVVFDPRLFFGKSGGSGNWISFGSWFYDGSWWAFRLAIAALVLYGITAVTADTRPETWASHMSNGWEIRRCQAGHITALDAPGGCGS